LHFAFFVGAPVKALMALLEAYPDATPIPMFKNNLPCHSACSFGISPEAMKMLLRCNPDAASVMNDRSETPLECLDMCVWDVHAAEK
jgi:hypothetical protein